MSEAFGNDGEGEQSQMSLDALRHIHEANQRRQLPSTISVDSPLYASMTDTIEARANKPIRWDLHDHHHHDVVDNTNRMEMVSVATAVAIQPPAPRPGTTAAAPTTTTHGATQQQYAVPAHLEERWKRLMDEERQLNLLAAEVERKEHAARVTLQRLTPNFPPEILCIHPLVHHNIPADIPLKRQRYVQIAFGNWIATSVLLILNFVVNLAVTLSPNKDGIGEGDKLKSSTTSQHVGLSAAYLTGIVFAFMLWYWQLYKSCAFGRSTTYIISFVGLIIGAAFSAFIAIGITGLGGSGAVFASDIAKAKGTAASIPVGIVCAVWAVQVFVFLWLIFRLRTYYREDGASTEEAKRQVVQSATRTAARHAI